MRPAFLALLVATGLLYLCNLSASGYANSFYSAAVQAGSQSWKALFFGSLDSANAITVDKPPASLWPMALSVRIFGLAFVGDPRPRGDAGVATVGVLYGALRRRFSPAAGLIAGAVLALTPVAALMFRLQQPGRDARAADDRHDLLRGPRWRTAGRSGWSGRVSGSASPSSRRPCRPS